MGQKEEHAVRELLIEFERDPWDDALIERVLDRMTPDARYHVYSWERPRCGRDEIRAELVRQASAVGNFRSDIKAVASTGHTVLIERVDFQTVGKKQRPLTLHVAGVFEV